MLSIFKNIIMKFNIRSHTTNKAGGEAFAQDPQLELISLLLTSFVEDNYYSKAEEQIQRLKNLSSTVLDKKFIAKAAIFARIEIGIRSASHVLIGSMIDTLKGEIWLKNAIAKAIVRPDDITEITAYYLSLHVDKSYKKGLPAALRKGIKLALNKFDSYQIAKYKSAQKNVKMVDIFNLVHPKPTKENQPIFASLIDGTLKSKDTWEAKLSETGQKAKNSEELKALKKNAWHDLITQKKIGYLALLRNLRNIIHESPECLESALEMLINPFLIKKSKVLPFRFLTAIEEIKLLNTDKARLAVTAINEALEIALSNVPKFAGKTLIALDCSGSMQGRPINVGALFAASLVKSNNADLIIFSDEADYFSFGSLSDSLSTMVQQILAKADGGGTNFHSIFTEAHSAYDRIIILSDMQAWMGNHTPMAVLKAYKKYYNCNPVIYSVDLNGYGTLQFPEQDVYCIAGFSEKIFDYIKLFDTDKQALINKIHSIEI